MEAGGAENMRAIFPAPCALSCSTTAHTCMHADAPRPLLLATSKLVILQVEVNFQEEDAKLAYESHDDARLRFSDGIVLYMFAQNKELAWPAPACS